MKSVLFFLLFFLSLSIQAQTPVESKINNIDSEEISAEDTLIHLDSLPVQWFYSYLHQFLIDDKANSKSNKILNAQIDSILNPVNRRAHQRALQQVIKLMQSNQYYNQSRKLLAISDSLELRKIQTNAQNVRLLSQWKKDSTMWMDSLHIFYAQNPMMDSLVNIDSVISSLVIFQRPQYSNPYDNDTLQIAINSLYQSLINDSVYQWIQKLRNDTIEISIVGLENDSLKVHLFRNNSQILYFSIHDLFGGKVPVMVRDIKRNSFRMIVDKVPDASRFNRKNTQTSEILEDIYEQNRVKHVFTLKKRVVPNSSSPWIMGGFSSVQLTQVHIDDQWPKGGKSSFSFMYEQELFANYKLKNAAWENKFIYRFGMIKLDKEAFKANEDRLELHSKFGYKAFKKFNYSGIMDFKTQSTNMREYPNGEDKPSVLVSQFFSPANFTFAVGLEYKPKKTASFFVSPLTSKTTFVLNKDIDPTRHGVEKDKTIKTQTGAIIKIETTHKLWDDLEIENRLELFSNYLEDPQNVDIDLQLKFVLPINDFVTVNIFTHFIYDDNLAKRLLIQERLSVGALYKF